MSIKLHYAPKTRSTRPRWLLEELGLPYDLVRINLGEKQHKSAEYMKVHPLGLVPAMEIDGVKLIESTAMVGYLADKYPDKALAPALTSKDRASYWQWLVFATTTVEPSVITYWTHSSKLAEDKRHPDIAEEAAANFRAAVCRALVSIFAAFIKAANAARSCSISAGLLDVRSQSHRSVSKVFSCSVESFVR